MTDKVVVYDPDGINPYGRELALVLASSHRVSLLLARDAEWLPDSLDVRAILAGNRPTGRVRQALALAHGLLAVVRRCAFGRSALVAAWSRSFFEEVCFSLLARTGTHVVFVEHNPQPRFNPSRWRTWSMEQIRRSCSALVVHGPLLREQVALQRSHPRVHECMHPPYLGWWTWARDQLPAADPDNGTRLLMLGRPRPDKGTDELTGILKAVTPEARGRMVLRFCGYLAGGQALPDVAGLVRVEDRTADRFLTDAEVAQSIADSSILVAPLRGATQSGSVVLALSAGLGVLAYDEGEVGAVVDDHGLVARGDQHAFAAKLAAATEGAPVGGARLSTDEWVARCRREWAAAVDPR